jgi:hypothetical protein
MRSCLLPTPRFSRQTLLRSACFDPRSPCLGPHEGREVALFRLGWKQVALFGDVIGVSPSLEEEAMIKLANTGACQRLTIVIPGQLGSVFSFDHRYSLFIRPGQVIDLPEVHRLLDWRSTFQDLPPVYPDLALGRLLGYSDQDSFAFTLAISRPYGCYRC